MAKTLGRHPARWGDLMRVGGRATQRVRRVSCIFYFTFFVVGREWRHCGRRKRDTHSRQGPYAVVD